MSKVVKSIKKGVKKVLKSPLGKVLMVAAAVYTGGAALGYWKAAGALGKINGVLKAGKLAGAVSQGSGTAAQAFGINGTAQGASMAALKGAAVPAAKTGFIGKTVSGAANFIQQNPTAAAMALNATASAASPDEMDLMHEQNKLNDQDLERELARRNKNLNVSGVKIPSGFISRNGGQV